MYGDNPATNSRKNRFFGYVEESSIDYFSKLEELYQQDNHADYKIQVIIKLYPGGKITNAKSIDITETTNC